MIKHTDRGPLLLYTCTSYVLGDARIRVLGQDSHDVRMTASMQGAVAGLPMKLGYDSIDVKRFDAIEKTSKHVVKPHSVPDADCKPIPSFDDYRDETQVLTACYSKSPPPSSACIHTCILH